MSSTQTSTPATASTPPADCRRGPSARVLLATGVGLAAASALLAPVVGDGTAVAQAAPAMAPDSQALDVAASTEVGTPDAAAFAARAAAASGQTSRSAARGAVPAALAAEDAPAVQESPAAEETPPEPEPEPEPTPEAAGKRYATSGVNVRSEPSLEAEILDTLDRGDRVTITDTKEDGWQQVLVDDEVAWIRAGFLGKSKPSAQPRGLSSAPCASGSGVESGLTGNAIAVHRAVCGAFPQVTSYGGLRGGGGNHGSGRAVDIMIPSNGTGDAIAAYVRANAGRLGVTEVIWEQKIWTTQRAGDGWRPMSDRGSATANHYDHVHVTVG